MNRYSTPPPSSRKYGSFSSSVNPEQLSARVTGSIIALSGVIIYAAGNFLGATNITPADIQMLAEQAGDLVGSLVTAYGAAHGIFGFIRMLVVKNKEQ